MYNLDCFFNGNSAYFDHNNLIYKCMGDFKRDGGKRFGGGHGGGFGGRDRGPVTMHQAVCDQCGKPCEVPFRPTDGKPVYCNVCFGAKKNAGSDRGGDRFQHEKSSNFKAPVRTELGSGDELKKQLVTLNSKMDRLIQAVESLKSPKPAAVEEKVKKTSASAVPAVKEKKSLKKAVKKKKK